MKWMKNLWLYDKWNDAETCAKRNKNWEDKKPTEPDLIWMVKYLCLFSTF